MNDSRPLNPVVDQQLDRLLDQSFKPSQALSADFDAKVMSSIRHERQKAHSGRGVLITMLVYWAIASLVGAWVLLGNPSVGPGENLSYLKFLLPLMGFIAAGLWFVVHQTKLRLSDLFLQTIQ